MSREQPKCSFPSAPELQPGQMITTGTCVVPVAIVPGDHLVADFGDFGQVAAVMV
jgi:2-keto-4-pentenoate hydratase